jgi:F-type H+-transporting ATPase subunit a
MNISEYLQEAITPRVVFRFDVLGAHVKVVDAVVCMWVVTVAILALAFALTRNLKLVPGRRQAALEYLVQSIEGMCEQWMGHYARAFAPWFGSVFIFLLFSNILSVFDICPWFKLTPPTKNINVTGGLAVMSIVLVVFGGIIVKGPKHWLKTFVTPSPIMIPFKLMDYVTRPLSLALRLFGNIFGAFVIMELIYFVIPIFIPAAFSIYFDLFDGAIQAFIFSYLSMIYLSEVLE